jgi:hypothetical protein
MRQEAALPSEEAAAAGLVPECCFGGLSASLAAKHLLAVAVRPSFRRSLFHLLVLADVVSEDERLVDAVGAVRTADAEDLTRRSPRCRRRSEQ